MTPTSITDGTAQPLTAAGAVAPTTGLDISGLSGDYELEIEVSDLHSASGTPIARVTIEDTVNAFTAAVPICEFDIEGPIVQGAPVRRTWKSDQIPGLRIGVTAAAIRAHVVMLNGTTPSITLRAALWN